MIVSFFFLFYAYLFVFVSGQFLFLLLLYAISFQIVVQLISLGEFSLPVGAALLLYVKFTLINAQFSFSFFFIISLIFIIFQFSMSWRKTNESVCRMRRTSLVFWSTCNEFPEKMTRTKHLLAQVEWHSHVTDRTFPLDLLQMIPKDKMHRFVQDDSGVLQARHRCRIMFRRVSSLTFTALGKSIT